MPRGGAKGKQEAAAPVAVAAASGGGGRQKPTRPLNLKGKPAADVVGQCVQVLYDEGGPGLVPYLGVIVYLERHRCAQRSRPGTP
jgi:hypothetical protein